MADKKKRRVFQKPNLMTERIEVRCSPEEKDAIYAAALGQQKAVSRYVVEAAMILANKNKANNHE